MGLVRVKPRALAQAKELSAIFLSWHGGYPKSVINYQPIELQLHAVIFHEVRKKLKAARGQGVVMDFHELAFSDPSPTVALALRFGMPLPDLMFNLLHGPMLDQ